MLSPIEAANKIINEIFTDCDAALLSGSVTRNEYTTTSDLDIVVFYTDIIKAYRESFTAFGWRVEVFVHNEASFDFYFLEDYKAATPSLQNMVSEGVILKAHPFIYDLKDKAKKQLEAGPEPWSAETISLKRYFITDKLDDFISSNERAEDICIAGSLFYALQEFYLRTNGQWIGNSKWIMRALKRYNVASAENFYRAFNDFYVNNNKKLVISLTNELLEPFGGMLFDGFSMGKE